MSRATRASTRTQDFVHAAKDPDVGDALLAHVEEHARERGFPHVEVGRRTGGRAAVQRVQRNGYARDREILRMWRVLDGDLPEPRLADGVTVRTYADADAERVHALLDEAYAGWDTDLRRAAPRRAGSRS